MAYELLGVYGERLCVFYFLRQDLFALQHWLAPLILHACFEEFVHRRIWQDGAKQNGRWKQ